MKVVKKNMIIKNLFISDSFLILELKSLEEAQNILYFLVSSDFIAALRFFGGSQ